jgi:hypothetical protein
MLFRVFEHYDHNQDIYYSIDQENEVNKSDECFICYEFQTDSELTPISLRSELNYIKECTCNGWIHKKCLDLWCKKNKKCPICRIEIREKVPVFINIKQNTLKIYVISLRILYNTLFGIINFLLIYTFLEILSKIYSIKKEKDNNNQISI